jgi:hypothetical protein
LIRPAASAVFTLSAVPIPDEPGRDEANALVDAAIANAAMDDIYLDPDEQELIRLYQRDEIDREEFLRRARAVADRKAGPAHD